jgi:hypothetical protein
MNPLAPLAAVLGLLVALVVMLWTVLAVGVQTGVCALARAVGYAAEAVRRRVR